VIELGKKKPYILGGKSFDEYSDKGEFKACGIWPLDKNVMDEKMALLEEFCQKKQEEIVSIKEVVDINDAYVDNVPCRYFVVEEEMSILDIVNLVFIEEKQRSAITPFLTLLRHIPPTKETTTNPMIDYSWPLVMTSDESWMRWRKTQGRKHMPKM
jgi:hypothetical protein